MFDQVTVCDFDCVLQRRKRDGDFVEAEKLYMEAGSWKEAVNMYMQQSKWEDARRVCQEVGTDEAHSKEGFIGSVAPILKLIICSSGFMMVAPILLLLFEDIRFGPPILQL